MSGGLESWGRLFPPQASTLALASRFDRPAFDAGQSYLPYGRGRSYGDVCLNAGGTLLDSRGLDRFIDFDPASGLLHCEAGVTFEEIIRLCLPQGWFLPVTPGTKFLTVGGAIANDVHGKNHHRAGTFGCHVERFTLLRSDGGLLECSATEHAGLFSATIGGLGLTGLICSAVVRLRRVPGPWLAGDSLRFRNLAEFFALSSESDRDWEYTVAWIDCRAAGRQLGRGVFLRANHCAHQGPEPRPSRRNLFFTPPVPLVNAPVLAAFNPLYYHRPAAQRRNGLWHWDSYFYPLDGIRHWNRMYGPRGFYQYQCVIPTAGCEAAIAEQLRVIADAGEGSMLVVLKVFGDIRSPGMLSFPRAGATLALDFANRGERTLALLDRLEAITRAASGREYPAKDARMSPQAYAAYFGGEAAFDAYRDPRFSSSFWRRVHSPSPVSP